MLLWTSIRRSTVILKPLFAQPSIVIFVLAVLLRVPLGAQSGSASLSGSVLDPSASLIPGATVTLLKDAKLVRTVKTDATGRFEIPSVPPGNFTVRAVAVGFEPFEVPSYTISAGSKQELNMTLALRVDTAQEIGRA